MDKIYKFPVTGADEKQCLEKVNAANDIVINLKHADLLLLANAVKTKSDLIDMARPFLT